MDAEAPWPEVAAVQKELERLLRYQAALEANAVIVMAKLTAAEATGDGEEKYG